jgi:uncharacterized protein (TIGR04255 family)
MPAAKPASLSQAPTEQFGRRYSTADASSVLQLRRDGMTFSILKDYQSWDETKALAQGYWDRYSRLAPSVPIQRLAVRYINVLEFSVPVANFDDYLTAGPRIPHELPQRLTGFLHRVVIPFDPDGTTAIVTQALEPPKETRIPMVLDIDVFVECSLDGRSAEMWSRLDKLRNIKNAIFFSSVTERALETYR